MKQQQRGQTGRKGQKQGRNNFPKVHCLPKLDRISPSFEQGAKGAKGRFFEKTFPPTKITDSPNLIQVNSISHNLRPHGTCINPVSAHRLYNSVWDIFRIDTHNSHGRRLFKGIQLVPVKGPEDEPAPNAVEAGAQGAQRGQE